MRKLPSLNALRFFDSAARQLNFSLAAKELFVTHSAVSQQIRQLESWLGCALFERHGSGVRLTDAGLRLQLTADEALNLLETRCNEIRRSTEPSEIVLGLPASFLANWLIPRVGRFEAENAEVRLSFHTTSDITDLLTRRVDAMLLSEKSWPDGINVTPLFPETIGPVCSPGLAENIRQPSDVLNGTLLHTTSREFAWDDWARNHTLLPCAFRKRREFDHLSPMLEAAAAGLGIAIAPEILVREDINRGRLVAPLGFAENDAYWAYCTPDARPSDVSERLKSWLKSEAGLRQVSQGGSLENGD